MPAQQSELVTDSKRSSCKTRHANARPQSLARHPLQGNPAQLLCSYCSKLGCAALRYERPVVSQSSYAAALCLLTCAGFSRHNSLLHNRYIASTEVRSPLVQQANLLATAAMFRDPPSATASSCSFKMLRRSAAVIRLSDSATLSA